MISVIIPTYNEEQVIKRCLDSLLKQKNSDFEIIVVDDQSTDKTVSRIHQLAEKKQLTNNKIRLYKQKHLGPGSARNLGAKRAKGEILVFVDSDMTFTENFLADLVKPIKTGITKGTFTKNEYVSNWDNVWARCWNYNQGICGNKRIPDNYPDKAPVFRAILKSEFEKVAGFDLIGYTDDWSLSRKLGYMATAVQGAKCYHKNPESLEEIYTQASWIGKNEFITKGGRKFFNLVRYFAPISLLIGIIKSIIYGEPKFIKFKIIYDQAVFISILGNFTNKNLYK